MKKHRRLDEQEAQGLRALADRDRRHRGHVARDRRDDDGAPRGHTDTVSVPRRGWRRT
jgi:hypothetical protein